jgi:hypothetical protein
LAISPNIPTSPAKKRKIKRLGPVLYLKDDLNRIKDSIVRRIQSGSVLIIKLGNIKPGDVIINVSKL